MRKYDELLDKVRYAITKDIVNGLEIYFTYETEDEIANIEIYDNWTNKVLNSYTYDFMNIDIISKDYPQFF